jgi:acetyl esterase/lipase
MQFSRLFVMFQVFVISVSTAFAQEVFHLWEKGQKPFYKVNDLKEYEKEAYQTLCVFDVTEPSLTIYPAKGENTGKAVLIIPGGGYGLVAMYHEGYDIAKVLSEQGITAAVLKYRLPNPKSSDQPEKVPLADARRAMVMMHNMAKDYGFAMDKIGVMGFSAGSHLATIMGLWPAASTEERPDFSALIYGVTDLSPENLKWLEESLYYRKLTPDEIEQNTLLDLVNKNTPPTFLVHAYDDDICRIEESTHYAQKLQGFGINIEMHLFSKGGHGFGIGREADGTNQWLDLFVQWLNNNF